MKKQIAAVGIAAVMLMSACGAKESQPDMGQEVTATASQALSPEDQEKLDEVNRFADQIRLAVKNEDMEALDQLCSYPVYVAAAGEEGTVINMADNLEELNTLLKEHPISDQMKEQMETDQITRLAEEGYGYLLGRTMGIYFNETENGFGIDSFILE